MICFAAFFAMSASAQDCKRVKYVFMFIGDGMSIPQRMATDAYLKSLDLPTLAINKMPYQALTTTNSADHFITDSAASGTAIACGTKVPNHYVGVDAAGKKLESTAFVAKKSGKKVGIITSVTLNHATPAAFYAHTDNRSDYYKIGLDLVASGFDFFGGGAIAKHDFKKSKIYKGDVLDIARKGGYKIFDTPDSIKNIKKSDGKVIALADRYGAMPYAIDAPDSIRGADILKKAIEVLDSDAGFFIMLEGGKVDWMCHANDAATTIVEVVDFDKSVQVAIDFAKTHPDETLIVVTGDHETGGLTLGFAGTGYESYIYLLPRQTCSVEAFEKKVKTLVKNNPDATFDDAKKILSESFGFKFDGGKKGDRLVPTKAEIAALKEAFERERQLFKKSLSGGKKEAYERKKSPLAVAAVRCFNNKAGVAWTSNAHTALPVLTTAQGVNAEMFSGMIDNCDIAKKLKKILQQ